MSNPTPDTTLVIERRKRSIGGRTTYWVNSADPRLGIVQVNSDRAKNLVAWGLARWAGEPKITKTVEEIDA